MTTKTTTTTTLALYDPPTPVKAKLAAAWAVVGESWMYFYGLGVLLEVMILAFILRSAWTWPRRTS